MRVITAKRGRPSAIITLCFIIIGGVVLMAIPGSVLSPKDPHAQNLLIGPSKPSGEHWFGTDALGRDVFSRVIAGSRSAFIGPLVISLGSLVLGNLLGLLAGYRGGR